MCFRNLFLLAAAAMTLPSGSNAVWVPLDDPIRPAPPATPVDCPVGYASFVYDFSEFASRQYITEIAGFCEITAIATPFHKKGYTPVPAGRGQPHNPWGGAARVMRTDMPHCKADPDLCTPNVDFGGSGVGAGGGNNNALGVNEHFQGNVMILQERNKRNSDDSSEGGAFVMELNEAKNFYNLTFGLLDVGNRGGDETASADGYGLFSFVLVLDLFNLPYLRVVPDVGDNSFQEVVFGGHVDNAKSFMLRVQGSGALSYVKGCMKDSELPPGFPDRPDECAEK